MPEARDTRRRTRSLPAMLWGQGRALRRGLWALGIIVPAPWACVAASPGLVEVPASHEDAAREAPAADQGQSPGAENGATPAPTGVSDDDALLGRVANSDPRHAENQPDWDARAKQLAGDVLPRMKSTTAPRNLAEGCRAMLMAAQSLYDAVETTSAAAADRRRILVASFEDDLQRCEAESSIEAVHCATILLGDHNAEFAWLLDQCSRAFPRRS